MTYEEFCEFSHFVPTVSYYRDVIEPEYTRSGMNEREFCRKWKNNGGIQNAYKDLSAKFDALSWNYDVLEAKFEYLQERYKKYNTERVFFFEQLFEIKRIVDDTLGDEPYCENEIID